MTRLKTCKNKCIFCFISQLPKGLRPSLYIKDDDFVESYSHGNFITLTNISVDDLKKIIRFNIQPLNISLHSFNGEVRELLFGNRNNMIALKYFKELDINHIATNIQIVLCPGINDGKDLENTLNILINKYSAIKSIGIVPVGITKYNRFDILKSFDRDSSLELLLFIKSYKEKNKNNPGSSKIYISDEFYLMAGSELPGYDQYGKFFQIQNGIGKSIDFIRDAKRYMKIYQKKEIKRKDRINNKKILIISSEYGEIVIKKISKIMENTCRDQSKIELLTIKNNFFGGNVKVTGLLTGIDIISSLKNKNIQLYDNVLIPKIIFNIDGLTLDGYRIEDIKRISDNINIIEDNGVSFVKAIINFRAEL